MYITFKNNNQDDITYLCDFENVQSQVAANDYIEMDQL